mgnify:CR=1 FL=1
MYTNKGKLDRYFQNISVCYHNLADRREGIEESQPFQDKRPMNCRRKEKIIIEQNITIKHLRKEVARLKDKIISLIVEKM